MANNLLSALSSNEVNAFLSHIKHFEGPFPSNLVPLPKLHTVQSYIINTEPEGQPGEHWTALIIDKNNKVLFFDPLGVELLNIKLLETLKDSLGVKNYIYNTKTIQPLHSDGCGYYCIAFIMAFSQDITYEKFLEMFSVCKANNESIVLNFICNKL